MRRAFACRAAVAAALATSLAFPAAALAQSAAPATGRASGSRLSLIVGAGGVFAGSQNDAIDRSTGAQAFAGLEFAQPWRSGFLGRLAVRVEGSFSSQNVSETEVFASGDMQTVNAAALVTANLATRGRFETYALAGPVWSRVSTKLTFDAPTNQTPGAGFQQTTHETAPGVALGLGAGWHVRAVDVRLEARWMSLSTNVKSTTMVPVLLSVAVPLHR